MSLAFSQDFKTGSLDASFDFARAGSANCWNASGVLVSVAADMPRWDYGFPAGATPRLLVEDSRTNWLKYCRDLTQTSAWTKTGMTAAKTQTGIDNAANSCTLLTATSSNATIKQTSGADNSTRVFSVFLKRVSGTGNIQLTVNNGTNWTTVTLTSSWQRFSLPTAAANAVVGIRIVTSGNAIAVDYAQHEYGRSPSTPIYTTTTTVDRATDYLSIASPAWYNASQGTFVIAAQHTGDPVDWPWLVSFDDGETYENAMGFYSDFLNARTTGYCNSSGTNQFDGLGYADTTGNPPIIAAMRYQANNFGVSINNGIAENNTSAAVPVNVTQVQFGNSNSGNTGPMHLDYFQYYNTALSDADLQTLSNGGSLDSSFSAAGTSTVSGVGASFSDAAGQTAGTSVPAGVGASLSDAVGQTAGTGTAEGIGASFSDATAEAAGASEAGGVGSSTGGESLSITAAQQRLEVGVFIELFTLDATALGAGVLCWTPSRPSADKQVIWRGNTYLSVDIMAEGFEKNTSGAMPRPRLSIGNADNIVGALLGQYGDFKGCRITRTKTLYECLDDQPGADPDAIWPEDIFRVERKVSQNKNKVVLELAAATDNAGARIPGRLVLRDICSWIYRRWDGETFNYMAATCPYAGTACYDALGRLCGAPADICGKRLSDCKLRFGGNPLPFGGFPGAARVRLN